MNNLLEIYTKLLSNFHPQHWWPVTEQGKLHPEYSDGPKNEKQQLEVIFGAILTQNTSWKNVEKAIANLNKHNLISIQKIIKIKNEKLAQIIKSSGYHNQKAKKLKNFCNFLLKDYDGKLSNLFKVDIAKLRNELLSVNGIGPETADSIILYAAKKPIFVIDAYTKRILNRIGYKEETYEELQRLFMQNYRKLEIFGVSENKVFRNLPNSEKLFNEYHALLVELGKSICKKNPLCEECPINRHCDYYKNIYTKKKN